VGDLQTSWVHDFFEGFALGARATCTSRCSRTGDRSPQVRGALFNAFCAGPLRVAWPGIAAWQKSAQPPKPAVTPDRLQSGNLTSLKALATIVAESSCGDAGHLANAGRHHRAGRRTIWRHPRSNHRDRTRSSDRREGRPRFGICLGMRGLLEGARSAGASRPRPALSGRCYRLTSIRRLPIPLRNPGRCLSGWNSIANPTRGLQSSRRAELGSQCTSHPTATAPVDWRHGAVTEHARLRNRWCRARSISGGQFHPEKSARRAPQPACNFGALADEPKRRTQRNTHGDRDRTEKDLSILPLCPRCLCGVVLGGLECPPCSLF